MKKILLLTLLGSLPFSLFSMDAPPATKTALEQKKEVGKDNGKAVTSSSYQLWFNSKIPVGIDSSNALPMLVNQGAFIGTIDGTYGPDIIVDLEGLAIPFPDVTSALATLKEGRITAFFVTPDVANAANVTDPSLASLDNVTIPPLSPKIQALIEGIAPSA